MDVKAIQAKLNLAGAGIIVDGDLGPKTFTALINYMVGKNLGSTSVLLGRSMAVELKKYEINTQLRIFHFLAQAAHETSGFRYFSELGSGKDANKDGFDDYLQKYDFRKDLGNNAVGMGPKYRGRGIFQLTGYFNYVKFGKRIGIDLAKNPEIAAQPDISVTLACLYWSDRKINAAADNNNIEAVTKLINGGKNGLDDRKAYFAKLSKLAA
jgi:putative chitinase